MTTFNGTDGDDILPPPGGDNSGNDDFFAFGGNDTVHGGPGMDNVDAGSGNDIAYGDDGDDTLSGGADNDTLYGGNGVDSLDGGGGDDVLDGGPGADTMIGNFGNDRYYVDNVGDTLVEYQASDGVDRVYSTVTFTLPQYLDQLFLGGSAPIGGTGNAGDNTIVGNSLGNHLFGLAGNDKLDGAAGGDWMQGGTGDDTYYVDNASDLVDETGGDGTDKVISSIGFSLKSALGDVENVTLTGGNNSRVKGNALDNVILGNSGANLLDGGSGDDTLKGNDGDDRLLGGKGNDTLDGGLRLDQLTGGAGADRLTGGLDADTFIYLSLADSTVASLGRDTIFDFSHAESDKIDLSAIDGGAAGQFNFIGTAAFSHSAGQLHYFTSGPSTFIEGDVNGDAVADFQIRLKGAQTLTASDFTL